MQGVPRAIRWYIALLAIGVAAFLTVAITRPPEHRLTTPEALMALGFILLTTAAGRFPLHVSTKTKFVVDTSLMFAAQLVFPPPVGPVVATFGVLLGAILDRSPLLDMGVNLGVTILECWATQAAYFALGGTLPPHFEDISVALPLVGAGLTMIVAEGLLVSLAIALYQGKDLREVLFTAWNRALKEDVALILLGVLTVMVVHVQPWALVLAAIPIVLVYLALRNSLRMEALTRDAVESLADLIDRRDPYTAGHSARVAVLAERLAMEIGLPWEEFETIRAAARVHDLGKIGIDASILTKPGRLSPEEWEQVRHHPNAGAEIIARFPEFTRGAEYVRYHHERWDGRGYPTGIKGDKIPQGACIIAVADSFDAMTSDRPYRKALGLDVVMTEFKRGAGVQWDEHVVAALLSMIERDRSKGAEVGVPAPAHA